MAVFKSSYKNFKDSFFRVEAGPLCSTLLVDEEGVEKFPLDWTRRPKKGRLIDNRDLSPSDRAEIELLWKGAPYKANRLLGCEDLEEALISYINYCGMASLSVAERKRLRAEQRRKQGYPDAAPVPAPSPARTPPMVAIPDEAQPSGGSPKGPAKKRKADEAEVLAGSAAADSPVDPSWRKHLRPVTSATADGPPKTVWDSRFPLNRVLNNAIPAGDRDKVATMGFGPAMAAIKSYGMWSSVIAHLVEGAFRQSIEEAGRMEDNLRRAYEAAKSLQADVKKYQENKSMLEGKVSKLSKELKSGSAKVESLEEDLAAVRKKLEAAEARVVELESVSESERYKTLSESYEELKLDSVKTFDSGFNTALAQIQALHPGLDVSEMDPDKIVVDGKVVDAPIDNEEEKDCAPVGGDEVILGSTAGPLEVPNEGEAVVASGVEQVGGAPTVEAVRQAIVMDSMDSEATP